MTGPPDDSAQRTRLAWRRTALAGTVVGLLAVRPAFGLRSGAAGLLLAAAGMVCWVGFIALAYRRTRGLAASPPAPGRGSVPAYAWITVGLAVLGGLVVLR
jgi:hypothetical protein